MRSNDYVGDSLTQREISVLYGIAKGNTNKGIAHNLGISDQTVKNYVSSIRIKLRAVDRTDAILKAITKGLITYDFGDYILVKKNEIGGNLDESI